MEAIITIVGFLGAGKTTLLKKLISEFTTSGYQPFVILNDYKNAYLDSQQLTTEQNPKWIKALNGSCICCSGIVELRESVNRVPERENGITLIEANGTSDACSLMEFLGVGLNDNFLPPIQISVVDTKNWQRRGEHNELEANQIQVSSLIVLTHLDNVSNERKNEVIESIKGINPLAEVVDVDNIVATMLPKLLPSRNTVKHLDHFKAHWSSCSVDLPEVSSESTIQEICKAIPKEILRVKGCTQIKGQQGYTYFERNPDGEIFIRPFNGNPITGPKLLTIGPGSTPELLENILSQVK